MHKGFLFGRDVLAWVLGAAEREGLHTLPDDAFPPSSAENGTVIGTLSPLAEKLVLNMFAAASAIERRQKEIVAQDSIAGLEAWNREVRVVIQPSVDALKTLIKAQVQIDLVESGVDMKQYGGFAVAAGGKIIGLDKSDSVMAFLDKVFGKEVTRDMLQSV